MRRRRLTATLVAFPWALFLAPTVRAEPLRLRADALAETRAPTGLVVLQGSDKGRLLEAEALVWTGARARMSDTLPRAGGEQGIAADVLVLTLRLRDPGGRGELRGGRFVFTTGAIRPIQIDGVSGLARAPWGTTLEAAFGAPVVAQAFPRTGEWVAGGRLAQSSSLATVGASYFAQRFGHERVTEEVGGDVAFMPNRWLDVAGRGAFDLISSGIAEVTTSAAARFWPWRLELFASHRSPGRLLPSTSLFSVLGDVPSQVLGTTVRWDAAPRLDLLAIIAGQSVGRTLGGYGTVRATLRTDERGDGTIGVEIRRQDVLTVRWSGARLVVSEPLGPLLRASAELELAWTDDRIGSSTMYPWSLAALGWRPGNGWEAALAVEAGASPRYSFETNALVRLSRTLGAL